MWLAAVTGYDQTTISRIEAGKARFAPDMMLRLAVALDMQLDELFVFPVGLVDVARSLGLPARRASPAGAPER
jgi:transcriptional regulator with XRE-family HTH domain